MPKGRDTRNDPARRPSNVISLDEYRARRDATRPKPKREPSPHHPSMQKKETPDA